MRRGRKLVLVAHCILNVNSRVEGLAAYSGIHPLIDELAQRDFGVIQMPCPEMGSGGTARPKMTIEEYDTSDFRSHCQALATSAAEEVRRYTESGHHVAAVVGMDGSPTCGVALTASGTAGNRVEGQGVFVRMLRENLTELEVPFVALDTREDDDGLSRVIAVIER